MTARPPAHHRRYDPDSRCRSFHEWPLCDQAAWTVALRKGRLFAKGGPLSHLSPATLGMASSAYGRFLTWHNWPGDETRSATSIATPELVAEFAYHLLDRNADYTVVQRLSNLRKAFEALCPGRDWKFVTDMSNQVNAWAVPARDKRSKLKLTDELFELGCYLMAGCDISPHPYINAAQFRDGLIISLMAVRPFRMRTFTMIELEKHLVWCGDERWLCFKPADIKTRLPLEVPFPVALELALDHYLSIRRPILLAQGTPQQPSDALWISRRGVPMKENGIGVRILAETEKAFDFPVNPNMFRDAAATTIAIDDPEHILMAARILGHTTLVNTERYYNLARSVEAARGLQSVVENLRRGAMAASILTEDDE